MSAESEVLLRFSLKEGLYKAIHPFVRRYVGFLEVRPGQTPLADAWRCALQPSHAASGLLVALLMHHSA